MLAPDNVPLRLFIAAQDGNDHDTEDQQLELLIIIQDRNDNHPRISRNFPLEITTAEVSMLFWTAKSFFSLGKYCTGHAT